MATFRKLGLTILTALLLIAFVAPASPAHAAPAGLAFTAAPDGYAAYAGQTTCSPTAKPGVTDFRAFTFSVYPATRDLGIVRACNVGGTSEHKEGRAWDWGVNADNAAEKAMADELLAWLLATRDGQQHAMMRRLGIMYMIWDRQIFRAYRANEGWQPYTGASPHTDHVHFSFSWAGANRQTTWWQSVSRPAACASVGIDLSAYPDLSSGDSGATVQAGQCLLNASGAGVTVDGEFGPATQSAVESFQSARSLPVTGTINAATWTALLAAGDTPTVRDGSAGPQVRQLQRALNAALDGSIDIDGWFGPQTDQAVRTYQSSRGLGVDGIVGAQTWGALQAGS